MTQTMVMGINTFQPRRMIWSERKRGKVARNHTNRKQKTRVLARNQCGPGVAKNVLPTPGMPAKGDSQPPRKIREASADMRIMDAYSARKNTANAAPEYSTWKPATISVSPSAMSNGRRLVSATPAMKKMTNNGSRGSQYHDRMLPAWASTMAVRLSVPDMATTPTTAKPMGISYEMVWAAARRPPNSAYLELEAQPASKIPYTLMALSATTSSRPASTSASTTPSANGMTDQAASAGISASSGASRYRNVLALSGMISSLNSILKTSAKG